MTLVVVLLVPLVLLVLLVLLFLRRRKPAISPTTVVCVWPLRPVVPRSIAPRVLLPTAMPAPPRACSW